MSSIFLSQSGFFGRLNRGVLHCRVLTFFLFVFVGAATFAYDNDKILNEVGNVFGLEDGKLVQIDLDLTPGLPVTTEIEIDDQRYVMNLNPYSIRSEDFVLRVQLADGRYEGRDPGVSRNLKGSLQGVKGSRVVGSLLESGLAAKIVLGDGTVYFVEPLNSRMDFNVSSDVHVLYKSTDTRPHECSCGMDHGTAQHVGDSELRDALSPTLVTDRFENEGSQTDGGGTLNVAELAIDADFEYFSDYGTEQATLARMELIVGIVNDQYEMDVDITHVISGAIVRTAEPDPYSSTSASTLLNQFRSHWLTSQGGIQRDVAHLFTGKNINGGVIGIAWDIGAICNNDAYCLSESDFNNNLGCATDLTAHELGHLWNGSHCDCPSHTMNPFITCTNDFNPTFTIPDIVAYRNTLTCLDNDGGTNPPPNDDWTNTIEIPTVDFGMIVGTNVDATTQANEQQLENTGSTAWWYITATEDGMMSVNTIGSDFDTQLHIYTGFPTEFENLVPVANNDDIAAGVLQSLVTFPVVTGECYEIRVGGWRQTGQTGPGAEGNIVLNGQFTPDALLLGDVNCDGQVNLLDVQPFIDLLANAGFLDKADINGDGVVNLLDVDGFITILSGS